jgi:protein Tex
MNEIYVARIAKELNVGAHQVRATIELLEGEATVPFIARYRKEVTGSLDEVAITAIRDRLEQMIELDKRRESILHSIEEQGKLTDELKAQILAAETMTQLEDMYLPYKPKRRTRATMAREKGLEPLAKLIWEQGPIDVEAEAGKYIDPAKEVAGVEDALAGARDIIAEWVNEDPTARARMREFYGSRGEFVAKVAAGKEEEAAKYRDYFDWCEAVATAPSHRILALRRGENEKMLTLRVAVPEEEAVALLESMFLKGAGPASEQVKLAIQDGYKRLMSISMAAEIRVETKKRADEQAISVFAENLRELLMASPLGQKNVLAIDPGFRTGCKVVCLDRQGKLLYHDVIYLHQGVGPDSAGGRKIRQLCEQYNIEAVAIGNGTASRETEAFLRGLGLDGRILILMVNESGASVYSASEVAREEFSDQDITVRGAVSIGRRLMDPLAELVKIDPKSIGVGQYQHDVDQPQLKKSLDDVVISCVNKVGVEVNTASKQLLMYISGLGPTLAQNIVNYRNENGPFQSRRDLLKVTRLGEKAFQQAAGFLRIRDSLNPLDASAVHPESYGVVDAMAAELHCSVLDLTQNAELQKRLDLRKYVTETVGLPTLNDIMSELAKPGRDPREKFEVFQFAQGVEKIDDVKVGMKLPGIVTNVTAFGAFVDIGVHQDGLVHISELADRFVKDPSEVVKVHQKVEVTVLEVDLPRNRIALSMRKQRDGKTAKKSGDKADGMVQTGKVNHVPPAQKKDTGRGTGLLSGLRFGDQIL